MTAVVVGGLWQGVTPDARSRCGTEMVRGRCGSGRVVEQELAEHMHATFDRRDTEPHLASASVEIALGFAMLVVGVWASV